jgi:hypothetical protein
MFILTSEQQQQLYRYCVMIFIRLYYIFWLPVSPSSGRNNGSQKEWEKKGETSPYKEKQVTSPLTNPLLVRRDVFPLYSSCESIFVPDNGCNRQPKHVVEENQNRYTRSL